jgi:ribonuclease HI
MGAPIDPPGKPASTRGTRKPGKTRTDAERRRLSKASRMRRSTEAEADLPIVWCDGGSRGNPGPAAIGFAVVADGRTLAVGSESIGVATAAVAEYRAVLAGLDAALAVGLSTVEVRTDSRLLVAQMTGEAPVRSSRIAPLADRATALRSRFALIRYRWVPEAQNGRAHELAEQALEHG